MPLERQIEPREYGKCQSEFLPIASRKYELIRQQVTRQQSGERGEEGTQQEEQPELTAGKRKLDWAQMNVGQN